MRPTLLESDRNLLRSAECAFVSIVAHAAVGLLVMGVTHGGRQIPTDEREARVFFLLPPDRIDFRPHQTEVFRWGKVGGDLGNGENPTRTGDEGRVLPLAYGAREWGKEAGARGELPFGPVLEFVPDTVFSMLEVDKTVERYDGSAAPVYPRELLAVGAEGLVQAVYVVDTTGRVDMSTIQWLHSDDPRFTASVRTALGRMLFRPAIRSGSPVRQQVQQQFRFRISPHSQIADQLS